MLRRALAILTVLTLGLALKHPGGPKGPSGPNGPHHGGDGDGGGGEDHGNPPKDGSDGDDGRPSTKGGGFDATDNVAGAHRAIAKEAETARPKDTDGDGKPDLPVTADPKLTPSNAPDPNATPRGERPVPKGNAERKRAIGRENDSADALARAGYDVEQEPGPKPNGKEPDYKIEGEYADCYSPSGGTTADGVRGKISDKVKKGQADRIVLNMDDATVSPAEIRAILNRRPIAGLKEIKIVKDGQVTDFYP